MHKIRRKTGKILKIYKMDHIKSEMEKLLVNKE